MFNFHMNTEKIAAHMASHLLGNVIIVEELCLKRYKCKGKAIDRILLEEKINTVVYSFF